MNMTLTRFVLVRPYCQCLNLKSAFLLSTRCLSPLRARLFWGETIMYYFFNYKLIQYIFFSSLSSLVSLPLDVTGPTHYCTHQKYFNAPSNFTSFLPPSPTPFWFLVYNCRKGKSSFKMLFVETFKDNENNIIIGLIDSSVLFDLNRQRWISLIIISKRH